MTYKDPLIRSGEEASKIMGVMEEIAFQTSLLALRAALEGAGKQTHPETRNGPAPPATIGHRASAQQDGLKDSQG
jgi:hypothetical protein